MTAKRDNAFMLNQYGDVLPKIEEMDPDFEGTELDDLAAIGFNYGLPDKRPSWLREDWDGLASHEQMRSSRSHGWE